MAQHVVFRKNDLPVVNNFCFILFEFTIDFVLRSLCSPSWVNILILKSFAIIVHSRHSSIVHYRGYESTFSLVFLSF